MCNKERVTMQLHAMATEVLTETYADSERAQ